ncbi:hypothetical protein KFE25_009489 [Diacronema lutheri]|uniref:Uncharacterized protein n=1 Tax=Diacronema lutheri TaxID=2081491 RepID=A0A8J6CKG8_DIALT|nr:hypothetical protein KFE25_009489 [Diacronema lutheri]
MQSAPRVSGGTLCAMGSSRLVLFGGRSSESGLTLGATRLVTVTWPAHAGGRGARPVARWDEVIAEPLHRPGARCYHVAVRWAAAERRGGEARMLVFGGAGDGADALHGDTWCLALPAPAAAGSSSAHARWERVACTGDAPAPRSSHVCAVWPAGGGVPVLHGGLGNDGVMSDVWTLDARDKRWGRMHAVGAPAARAHHAGAIVGDTLLVFSGQDERLLTVDSVCVLHLPTATWSAPALLPAPAPAGRIDAAGGILALGCAAPFGLVVFGGVGASFEFEPTTPWLVRADGDARGALSAAPLSAAPTAARAAGAPRARACAALASDALRVYAFGGFDGQQDLDELWCLSFVPPSFATAGASVDTAASRAREARTDEEMGASDVFRRRRAAQVKELQGLRGASGESYMPVHLRVWHAGAFEALADGEHAQAEAHAACTAAAVATACTLR